MSQSDNHMDSFAFAESSQWCLKSWECWFLHYYIQMQEKQSINFSMTKNLKLQPVCISGIHYMQILNM